MSRSQEFETGQKPVWEWGKRPLSDGYSVTQGVGDIDLHEAVGPLKENEPSPRIKKPRNYQGQKVSLNHVVSSFDINLN